MANGSILFQAVLCVVYHHKVNPMGMSISNFSTCIYAVSSNLLYSSNEELALLSM